MKLSILTAGFALLITAWCIEPAHAWKNCKFGVGMNISYQGGGNNLLWGLFRSGQPPAPCPPQQYPGFMPPGPGYGPPGFAPQFYPQPGFGEGAPTAPTPNQAGGGLQSVPTFFPVSLPGHFIPEQDFSEPMQR